MKKLLITGSSGFLGSRLALYYKDKYELLLPTHSQLNVSREEAVMAYMEQFQPDIVLHCAALSNTWYCEQHPDESHRVNVQGTVKIAKACKHIGAKLVFMSSDQVYNGTPVSGPLKEQDVFQPVNVYGRHKLEAEQRALRNNPMSVALRLTWMYDVPSSPMKLNSNILVNIQKALDEGTTIKAATHEYRGVTNVWEVVRNMEQTLELPGGIYNYGSGNHIDSYTLFLKVANIMGAKEPSTFILPDEERFSEQTRNLTMDCSLINNFGIRFNDSVEGIEKAIMNRKP
ncbi:sugar nucleotide-binding protein [uncultured Prevotella sp.]|uniref:SDR family oxidoreductase n=1 Tax=uncultured Prevotella sp. TaxID=159272 RepID=UPI0027E39D1B|nr:sugar nucleotide-binding protein [uncultured Prevotella sp.]